MHLALLLGYSLFKANMMLYSLPCLLLLLKFPLLWFIQNQPLNMSSFAAPHVPDTHYHSTAHTRTHPMTNLGTKQLQSTSLIYAQHSQLSYCSSSHIYDNSLNEPTCFPNAIKVSEWHNVLEIICPES